MTAGVNKVSMVERCMGLFGRVNYMLIVVQVVQPSLERAVEQGKPSMQASSQQAGILSKDKG